jgi:transposase
VLTIRDHIGVLFDDELFEPLFAPQGQPAEAPGVSPLSASSNASRASDRQAAEAVRDRLAWKYLLGLELTDTGFHYSVLSEFRDRLIAGGLELTLPDTMLAPFKDRGWLKAQGQQRTDSTHVLAATRTLNRLELVGETPARP